MDEWDIYAVGDVNFLYETIAATAAIFGKGDFEALVAIGFGFGIIWLFLQAIMDGGMQIKFGNFFLAVLLYMAMFGTTTTVLIYDGRNLSAPAPPPQQVNDVPLGLAATGSLLSKFGKAMSTWYMEQYTKPSQGGAAGTFALQALFEMRGMGSGNGSLNWDRHGHTSKSLENYVLDCVVPGTTIKDSSGNHPINASELPGEEDLWEALKFDSSVYTTQYYPPATPPAVLGGNWTVPEPVEVTCSTAHTSIETGHLSNANLDRWKAELARKSCQSGNTNCHAYLQEDASGLLLTNSASVNLDTGMNAIIGADVELDKLLINRVVTGAIDRAGSLSAVGQGDLMISTVMSRATAAMTTGQALEKGMFERTMRPLMTFFEAMMFIAGPFAAFAITLGSAGLGILSKYLVFALWIQLWNPVLAATNMYIHMAATGSMRALQQLRDDTIGDTINMASMQMQPQMFDGISHWIGTGSMLSAATPAITLMLMYGSAITASSLASRIDAPKGSEVGMDSLAGKSQVGESAAGITQHGNTGFGVEQLKDHSGQGTISVGQSVSNMQHRASQVSNEASASATHSREQGFSKGIEAMEQVSAKNNAAYRESHGENWSNKYANEVMQSLGTSQGFTKSESEAIRTGLSAGAGAGVSTANILNNLSGTQDQKNKVGNVANQGGGALGALAKMIDLKVQGGMRYDQAFEDAYKETQDVRAQAADSWKSSTEQGRSWENIASAERQHSLSDSQAYRESETYADKYQTQSSRAEKASEAYTAASQMQAQGAFSQVIETPGLVSQMRQPDNLSAFQAHVEKQQMNENGPGYYDSVNASNVSSGDYMNALQASIANGEVSDTSELLRMAGYDQAANNLDQIPGFESVGYQQNTMTQAPDVGPVGLGDNGQANDSNVTNRANQAGLGDNLWQDLKGNSAGIDPISEVGKNLQNIASAYGLTNLDDKPGDQTQPMFDGQPVVPENQRPEALETAAKFVGSFMEDPAGTLNGYVGDNIESEAMQKVSSDLVDAALNTSTPAEAVSNIGGVLLEHSGSIAEAGGNEILDAFGVPDPNAPNIAAEGQLVRDENGEVTHATNTLNEASPQQVGRGQ